jgi:hypothetical protein
MRLIDRVAGGKGVSSTRRCQAFFKKISKVKQQMTNKFQITISTAQPGVHVWLLA